jgi:hypothetical protein
MPLDFGTAYRIAGWSGVAWRAIGYATVWTDERWEYLGDEDDPDAGCDDYYERTGYYYPDENPANYLYFEPEQVEDRTRVRVVMIGDDQVFTVDVDDCLPLSREDYCGECGQIGCMHDGYDRD